MSDITERLTVAIADRYKIESHLGQGGMATVYLAHDVKHDRKVALKVLRPELAAVIGAERFLQEIKVTANLQHPNILALYDSGEADTFLYYVMPYIEGESLRDKLEREKQLAIEDAIEITRGVAAALDYAHRQGVIHRDIKPENILLHDGRPVVADFGIALAVSAAAGGRMTETGLSLGTPHYMSPEQATAEKDITNRSDVYSLGCVLYEMLAGDPPYTGSTAQAIVAKVITEKAAPVTAIRDTVPPHVAAVVQKALSKLPADRFSTAATLAEALVRPSLLDADRLSVTVSAGEPSRQRMPRAVWLLAAALVVMTAVTGWALLRSPELPVVRLTIGIPQEQQRILYGGINLTPPRVALTPDGSSLIYVGVEENYTGVAVSGSRTLSVRSQLWFRPLDELEARPMPGTQNGWAPEVSPDGEEFVFTVFGEGQAQVKIAAFSGGPPLTVAASGVGSSASWGTDGHVYFVDESGVGVRRVPLGGGPVEVVTTLAPFPDGARLMWPHVLPGARGAIATVGTQAQSRLASHELHAIDFASGTSTPLVVGVYGIYSPSGHIVYVTADGVLMAVPFDVDGLRTTGRPTALVQGVDYRNNGASDITISSTGTLIYATEGLNAPEIAVWVDRTGRVEPVDPGWAGELEFEGLALSPDGSRLAVELVAGGRGDIWIKQLDRGPLSRLSFEGTDNRTPAWSPDGLSVLYLSLVEEGGWELLMRRSDGSGEAERLPSPQGRVREAVWTPDGTSLVAAVSGPTGDDVLLLRLDTESSWTAILDGADDEYQPAVSPDGRWLAYVSEESGQPEVYVRPFPNTAGGKWQISTSGGLEPLWSADGRELYYRTFGGSTVWAASMTGGPAGAVRRELFSIPDGVYENNPRNKLHALTPDGRRFIMINQTGEGDLSGDLVFVQNFFAELKEKTAR